MGTTTNFALPYPELTDTPDGATQMKLLAQQADTQLLAVKNSILSLAAVKTTDTPRSNTTLANDPDLTLTPAVSTKYKFWCYLDYEGASAGTGDLKWTWAIPVGWTLRYQALYLNSSGGLTIQSNSAFTNTAASVLAAATNGPGGLMGVTMWGTLFTGGTAGSLTLQFAQNTSSATSTVLHAQSALTLDRIG